LHSLYIRKEVITFFIYQERSKDIIYILGNKEGVF